MTEIQAKSGQKFYSYCIKNVKNAALIFRKDEYFYGGLTLFIV